MIIHAHHHHDRAMAYILRARPRRTVNTVEWDALFVASSISLLLCLMSVQIEGAHTAPATLIVATIYFVCYCRAFFRFIVSNWIIILYPLVVLVSSTWSDTRLLSFWYATQFFITVVIGILVGISATKRQIVSAVFFAMMIVTIASIAWGRTGSSTVGPVLIGVTGSKDMMGFAGLTLMAAGLTVLFDRGQLLVSRLAALPLIPVGAYIAFHVEAAAAAVGAVAFVVCFFCICALRYVGRIGRWVVIGFAVLLVLPLSLSIISSEGKVGDMVLRSLGKDATLTGRTILWERADQWIAQAPEFGHGYRSFWVGQSADRNGILETFQQRDARGFQFHNTIKEIRVETGWLGLGAFSIVVAIFTYYVLANAFAYPGPLSAFMAGTHLLLLARMPIETIVEPFSAYMVLFYACGTAAMVACSRQRMRTVPLPTTRTGMGYPPGAPYAQRTSVH